MNKSSIDISTLVEKRAACIAALDPEKTCSTCQFTLTRHDVQPCNTCYNELLGMPVNPTKWVGRVEESEV